MNDRIKKKRVKARISRVGNGKLSYVKGGKNSGYWLVLDTPESAITMDGNHRVSEWGC